MATHKHRPSRHGRVLLALEAPAHVAHQEVRRPDAVVDEVLHRIQRALQELAPLFPAILGEKKHWCKGAIWEQTTHIPFIVRGPGRLRGAPRFALAAVSVPARAALGD